MAYCGPLFSYVVRDGSYSGRSKRHQTYDVKPSAGGGGGGGDEANGGGGSW